ncbi:hypothetical protein LLG95_06980 [bacterium]|nr:hypothetical protein [bacterium]
MDPRQPPTPGRSNQKLLIAGFVFFVFIAAFLVRRHELDQSSFWLDEIHQSNCTTLPVSQIWSKSPANKPPLDYYIQSLFIGRTPDETRGRIHACIIGSGVVALLGALGLLLGGWRCAWIMASLTLSLPLMIRYSQEGRPYILLLFSECLFFLVLWKMILGPKPIAARWWAALTASIVLCMWSHFLALFACVLGIGFVIAWILINPQARNAAWVEIRKPKTILTLAAMAAVIALAWWPLQARAAKALVEDFYAPFNRATWKGMLTQYLDIYAAGYEWYQYTKGGHVFLILLMTIGWLGWTLRKRKALFANFCLVLFLANYFGMFAFYGHKDHWMEMRYTIAALPPAILLAGMGVETILAAAAFGARMLGCEGPRLARIERTMLAAVCLFFVCGFTAYVIQKPFLKADWRGLGHLLKKTKAQPPLIMTAAHQDATAVKHYLKRYDVKSKAINYSFNMFVLETYMLFNEDVFAVWGIMGVNPKNFEKKLDDLPLHKVNPGYLYIDVRRTARPKEILAKAALGDPACPLLLSGWGAPDELGKQKARPMPNGRGSLFFDCPKPRDLTVAFAVRPDSAATTPTLSLTVNGTKLPARALHEQWNLASWKLDKKLVKPGRNVVELSMPTTATTLRVRDMKVIAWRKK